MQPAYNKYIRSLSIIPLALLGGCIGSMWDQREVINLEKPMYPKFHASVETIPVGSSASEDAADDPAIWIHPVDPSQSLVFGTNKKEGLHSYDLNGQEMQFLPVGRINNVDIRQDVSINGEIFSVMAGSNRTYKGIDIFLINSEGIAREVSSRNLKSSVDDVYGLSLYRNRNTGIVYVFVNGKNGIIEQWELSFTDNASVDGKIVRKLNVPSQPEGMVVDDVTDTLYVGEENNAIWKFSALATAPAVGSILANTSRNENENIVYDIEGLAIYRRGDDPAYLIASIQGNNSYAIYTIGDVEAYLMSFSIVGFEGIDGVEETDGLEVTSVELGGRFPEGILVVQDGYNFDTSGEQVAQNFKFVDWRSIQKYLNGLMTEK